MTCFLVNLLLAGQLYLIPACYDEPVYGWVDSDVAAWVG